MKSQCIFTERLKYVSCRTCKGYDIDCPHYLSRQERFRSDSEQAIAEHALPLFNPADTHSLGDKCFSLTAKQTTQPQDTYSLNQIRRINDGGAICG